MPRKNNQREEERDSLGVGGGASTPAANPEFTGRPLCRSSGEMTLFDNYQSWGDINFTVGKYV
jgi:hypothetical protein